MVSNLGYKLSSFAPISGFGYRRKRIGSGEGMRKRRVIHHVGYGEGMHIRRRTVHRRVVGQGIARKVAGTVVRHIGTALINKVADVLSGSGSFKLTGRGRRIAHRKPRTALLFGGRKRRPAHTHRRIRVMF